MIIILLLISLSFLIVWFSKISFFKQNEKYIPTKYETELIDYFNEIALKSEYFDNPEKITKWRKVMSLFIYKESDFDEQMIVINDVIESINNISADGFRIEITKDYTKANAFLYLCQKEKIKDLAPKFYDILNESITYEYSGFSYIEFKWTNFTITKALMFVDTNFPISYQKHAIREELTQSIGLSNDSNRYPNSIFYESDTDSVNYEYSKMDIALINFLYNPKMKPGYNRKSAELVIKKILQNEHNTLNR